MKEDEVWACGTSEGAHPCSCSGAVVTGALLDLGFAPVSASERGGDLGVSCSGTFPVRWSRDGLDSGAVSVVIGVPVISIRGEQSIFEKGFGVIAEPPG